MKEENFTRKDGSEGVKYKLEAGDKVVSRFDKPRRSKNGQYENISLGITHPEKGEVYLVLTKAQGDKLEQSGSLQGKEIEAYEYENEFGKQVGVRVL